MERIAVVLGLEDASRAADEALAAAARELADASGARLTALVLSAGGDRVAPARLPVDDLLILRAPWLTDAQPDAQVAALHEALAAGQIDLVLIPHNTMGREVGPRLAARAGAAVVTDCADVRFDKVSGHVIATRPCFSGKALSEWALPAGCPGVITLRRSSAKPGAARPAAPAASIRELAGEFRGRTRTRGRVVPPPGEIRLEDAEIVVSAGRGVGTREDFQSYIVDGLAKTLGAAVGGSRGAVDLGIVPAELQVGLTGRVVSPRVYIAIGLSGAPQHMAGCSGAANIVAINTDPQAPIFAYAQYGVVGDFRRVVPSLTEHLAPILAASR